MEQTSHSFSELFEQLGLPSDDAAIYAFCAKHRLDDEGAALPDAEFWTEHQAQFLREQWHQDSDWAMVIDQLNTSLRKPH
jgi:hypothetical protein